MVQKLSTPYLYYASLAVLAAVGIGQVVYYSTRPEMVCVEKKEQLVPIYHRGPKPHTIGGLKGYVEDEVCVKLIPKEKKPFVWPKAVY